MLHCRHGPTIIVYTRSNSVTHLSLAAVGLALVVVDCDTLLMYTCTVTVNNSPCCCSSCCSCCFNCIAVGMVLLMYYTHSNSVTYLSLAVAGLWLNVVLINVHSQLTTVYNSPCCCSCCTVIMVTLNTCTQCNSHLPILCCGRTSSLWLNLVILHVCANSI